MKKLFIFLLCAAMLAGLAGCAENVQSAAVESPTNMPNPVHYVSAQELMEETGMAFTVPELAENVSYSYIDSGDGSEPIAQVDFRLDGADCTARAQRADIPGDELPDISGMYYEWTDSAEAALGYNTAYFHLNPEAEGYVTWYDYAPGILYCVSMGANASVPALSELASATCPAVQGDSDGYVGDGTAMDSMTPASEPATYLPESELPATLDLNGDGKNETVFVDIADSDQGFGNHSLVITDDAGNEHRAETFIQYNSTVCVADIDLDGSFELLLSGDCGSDDYVAYAWRWDGELRPIRFSGELRRGASGEATDYADGAVEAVDYDVADGKPTKALISVGSFTYMLGTYGSVCVYELSADGTIAPAAPASWDFTGNEIWLETAVKLKANMDGAGETELSKGTKLRLTSTNGTDELRFETEDGKSGSLTLTYSADGSLLVGGVEEYDAFVSLPYAG